MFKKISLAIACLVSNTQAADVAAVAVADIKAAESAAYNAVPPSAVADIKAAERAAMRDLRRAEEDFKNGKDPLPPPPSSLAIPNYATPRAQEKARNLERALGRYAEGQGEKTYRALEPSLKQLDWANQSARVRTAGAIAQILRPATSAFALIVDKHGPGKDCNVPKFYDCWMGKKSWERDTFLLKGQCANASGCNVRKQIDDKSNQNLNQNIRKVADTLEQLDRQIQKEFSAGAEAFANVVQKESAIWGRDVMTIISKNFECLPGCMEQEIQRRGPNTDPARAAQKCQCKPPFATEESITSLIGMTTRDFFLTSAEDYVAMAAEPNPEVLEEDLDEEIVELQDAEGAKAAAASAANAAADAAAANGNDAAAQQIKDAAAAAGAGAPAAGADANAAAAGAADAAAGGAAAGAGGKSLTQKAKDAYAAAKDKAKSNPTVTIVIIVVVVLLLVGIGLFFYFRNSGKEEGSEEGGDMEVADLYRRLM